MTDMTSTTLPVSPATLGVAAALCTFCMFLDKRVSSDVKAHVSEGLLAKGAPGQWEASVVGLLNSLFGPRYFSLKAITVPALTGGCIVVALWILKASHPVSTKADEGPAYIYDALLFLAYLIPSYLSLLKTRALVAIAARSNTSTFGRLFFYTLDAVGGFLLATVSMLLMMFATAAQGISADMLFFYVLLAPLVMGLVTLLLFIHNFAITAFVITGHLSRLLIRLLGGLPLFSIFLAPDRIRSDPITAVGVVGSLIILIASWMHAPGLQDFENWFLPEETNDQIPADSTPP